MHDFRRLDVWHEALDLAVVVYRLTARLPATEKFGLVGQMRRTVVSVSSNIAEGASRGSAPELGRFLTYALGSLGEVDSQLELGRRLGLLAEQEDLMESIQRLRARIKTLHDRLSP